MGYVPLVKPQAGTRQFGVDFPAAGKSVKDGADELLLFVIKQGDIGRQQWSGGQNAVRQSMEEILDVFLASHIPPGYENHRKVIVVATTGDLSQDTLQNWSGFTDRHTQVAFEFWGADHVAKLLEQYLLDENLFDTQDRSDLRKSLALAGDSEYRFTDLCRLVLRQLGLNTDGSLTAQGQAQSVKDLVKALRRVHLAARICAYWADAEGERRQALWVLERTILWCFHRAQAQNLHTNSTVLQELFDIWKSHAEAAQRIYELLLPHLEVKDGFSGYCREGAEYSIMLFEQIGLLASIGIGMALTNVNESQREQAMGNAHTVAEALAILLRNHSAAASPRLDEHVIDICLVLVLFALTGQREATRWWMQELVCRLNFVYRLGQHLPVGTDSLDDLVELDVEGDDEMKTKAKQTSWLLATLASWCAMLKFDDLYSLLAQGAATKYPEVGAQLWHPSVDWRLAWYFEPGHHRHGTSEAPYVIPPDAPALRERIKEFNASKVLQWEEHSPALAVGLWPIDFLACRHFRTPVPASVWYSLAVPDAAASEKPEAAEE
ncbi:hypothetical protein E4Q23_22720 [Candidatus Accumulibacter phosphatis]|uniref:Uncharacterized protein n=1 Tax=Candidatus Accumulibacter phosphatis TaxID=327160 RepID=A0ABX1U4Z7_9PROT|nr:hypothetical protein [Candidatus Accumulibacter phosphatis]NMQ30322.1 hypothetical protein [Candidatus Accumulibacter phosphatis]